MNKPLEHVIKKNQPQADITLPETLPKPLNLPVAPPQDETTARRYTGFNIRQITGLNETRLSKTLKAIRIGLKPDQTFGESRRDGPGMVYSQEEVDQIGLNAKKLFPNPIKKKQFD